MGHPILRNNGNICYREFSKSHDYELPLSSALKKPTVQYRFMEDTFVICPLIDFLKHLNSIHPQIQLKRKKETNVELLLSDILLPPQRIQTPFWTKTSDFRSSRPQRHTNFWNRTPVIGTKTFGRNLSSQRVFECRYTKNITLRMKNLELQPGKKEFLGYASLPYLRNITDRIGRFLTRHNTKSYFKPMQEIRNLLRSVKDPIYTFSQSGV